LDDKAIVIVAKYLPAVFPDLIKNGAKNLFSKIGPR